MSRLVLHKAYIRPEEVMEALAQGRHVIHLYTRKGCKKCASFLAIAERIIDEVISVSKLQDLAFTVEEDAELRQVAYPMAVVRLSGGDAEKSEEYVEFTMPSFFFINILKALSAGSGAQIADSVLSIINKTTDMLKEEHENQASLRTRDDFIPPGRMKDHFGSDVILHLYTKTGCPPCGALKNDLPEILSALEERIGSKPLFTIENDPLEESIMSFPTIVIHDRESRNMAADIKNGKRRLQGYQKGAVSAIADRMAEVVNSPPPEI